MLADTSVTRLLAGDFMVPSDSDEMGIPSQIQRNAACPTELQHTLFQYTTLPAIDAHVKMRRITVLSYRLHLRFEYWIEINGLVRTALDGSER